MLNRHTLQSDFQLKRVAVTGLLLSLPLLFATCRVGDLLGPAAESIMVVRISSTPTKTAALGSTDQIQFDVSISNDGDGSLPWTAALMKASSWVDLDARQGTAPSMITVTLDPADLREVGDYLDTLVITASSGPSNPYPIPIQFSIEPCQTRSSGSGSDIDTELTSADCGAPHRAGHFAKVYSVQGFANDSISVVMESQDFQPHIAITTGIDNGTVIAESSECDGIPDTACLRYVTLPNDGTFLVEASSLAPSSTGMFTINIGGPRAPPVPQGMTQFTSDSTAVIQQGSAVPDLSVVLAGTIDDPDPGDLVWLEVEVQDIGTPFTDTPTHTSAEALGGTLAFVLAPNLPDNTSYHWQARTLDQTGRFSEWQSFGTNDDGETDFRVVFAEAPTAPTGLGQFQANEVTPIPIGATTSEQFVVFKGHVFDADPQDQLRLEVEVRPVGQAFTDAPNAVSIPVQSGDTALVAVGGFSDDTEYHWQARTIDQDNNVSLWAPYGGNNEDEADFAVFLPGAPAVPGSLSQLRIDSVTAIAAGDTIPESAVVYSAILTDPDPGDSIRLQVEVKRLGTSFINVPTDSSGLVASGAQALVPIGALMDDTNYHWQARAVDKAGTASAWVSFGGNLETDIDFRVAVPAVALAFGTQPPGGIAGEAMTPAITVEAREASGAVDTAYTGVASIAITLGSGAPGAVLSGTTPQPFVNGVATFNDLAINLIGTGYTLTAAAANLGTAVSQPFSINPAAAHHVSIVTQPPAAAVSGAPFSQQPSVQLQDINNNPVNQAGVLVTALVATGDTAATMISASASTDAAGLAQFAGLGITGLIGDYTVAFAAGGVIPDTSTVVTLSVGAVAQLAVSTQPSDTVQTGVVFPVQPVVQLQDGGGNPVSQAGIVVTASVAFGEGTLGGTLTATTAATGAATFTDLLLTGVLGRRTLGFAATGLTSTTSDTVNVIAGPAANLAIVAGDNQTAVAGSPVAVAPQVRVTDAGGNNVSGAPVTFAVLTGGGTVAPTTPVNTAADGTAAATSWILGATAGPNTLEASAPGTTPVTFTATGTSGAAGQLAIITQPSAAASSGVLFPQQPVVQVQDTNGNPVAQQGTAITAALASGPGGALGGSLIIPTDATGQAVFTNLAITGPTGDYTLNFSALGLTGTTSSIVTVGSGTATALQFLVQPSNVGAAAAITPDIQVRAVDGSGNPVTTFAGNVTLAITPSTGTPGAVLGGTLTQAAVAGVATFPGVSVNLAGTAYQLNATATGLTSTTSTPFDVTAGTATNLAFTVQPTTRNAGVAFSPSLQVAARDAQGNTDPNFVGAVTIAITAATGTTGANLLGTLTQNAVAGVATFAGVSIDSVGAGYTLTATGGALTAGTSAAFNINPGPATQLAFTTQPVNTNAGATITPAVAVTAQDAFGNTVPTFTSAVTIAIASGTGTGGAVLSGTTIVGAVGGVATFSNLSINLAGTGYQLQATGGGLAQATSTAFDIGSSSATQLAFTAQPTTATSLVAIAPAVQVTARDAQGNTDTGFTGSITVAITGGTGAPGAALGGTVTVAAVAGVATFSDLTVDLAGTGYTLTATSAGLTNGTSAAFNINAAAASQLAFTVQPTTRTAGVAFSPALQVTARDPQGNTATSFVGAVTIAITAATGTTGANLLGTLTQTAVAGVATFAGVSIDSVGTGYTLTGTSGALTAATSAAFNINPGAATQLAFTTQPVTSNSGASITPAVVVTAQDGFGNTATSFGGAVTVAIAAGTGTGGATLSGTTIVGASAGIATFSNLSIDLVGTGYQLQATSGGLPAATSAAFNIISSSATQLAFTVQPSNAVSAAVISPTVEVTARDAQGNTATGFTGSITVAITGGTGAPGAVLGGTVTATAVAGVAIFSDLTIDLAANGYTLTATSGGLTNAVSNAFNITPAPASQLAFTVQPSSRNAGVAFSPSLQVTALDPQGNTATSFVGSVTIAISAGTGTTGANLLGTLTQTASAGVAAFAGVSVDSVGTGYTLTATSGALTNATSVAFNITPAAPSQLVFTTQPANAAAGATITPSPVVTAKDAFGNTTPSFIGAVTIAITAGTGTGGAVLSGQTVVGAVSGVATFGGLSINLEGTGYTFTATASGLSNGVSAAFDIAAGAATQLDFTVQPTTATAGTAITPAIQVTARDGQGNVVTGFTNNVTLAISAGTGTTGANLGGTVTQAAVSGVATFNNLTIDSAGTGYTLTATSTGLANDISSAFTINPGAATQLAFTTQPTTTTSLSTIPTVRVTAQDALGNTVTSFGDAVSVALGGGTANANLLGTTSVSASGGVATFSTLSIDSAGTNYTLTATSGALTQDVSNTFNINPGAATSLVFTQQPSNGTAGIAISPAVTVTARDAAGNVATGFAAAVTLNITGGTGTAGAVLTGNVVGAVSGVATFSTLTVDSVGTGYTLDASTGLGGVTGSTSTAFDIAPGAAASLDFTIQPSPSQTAGVALAPEIEVTARDSKGNVATAFTGSITLTITDGTGTSGAAMTGGTSVAATAGVSRYPGLLIDSAGTSYTLTASAPSLSSAISSSFDVDPGSPAVLAFTTQPSNTGSAETITPAVVVAARDNQGNTATSFNGPITIAITGGTGTGGASLGGNTNRPSSSGVATFDNLNIDLAGTGYTLTATAGGVTSAVSSVFNITAGTAATLDFTVQPASPQTAGVALAPSVQVTARDLQGNVATSFSSLISLVITGGTGTANATLTGTTAVTAGSGIATFSNLLIDSTGVGYTLTASAAGVSNGVSSAFTVNPGAPATLDFTVQPSSPQTAGIAFSPAVEVTARDNQGNVATSFGNQISLAITGGTGTANASLTGSTDVSASSGIATFNNLLIDSAGVGYTLTASGSGVSNAVSSAFTVNPGTAATLVFTTQPSNTGAGSPISPAVVVTARDNQGNTATSFTNTVSVAITGGTGTGGAVLGGTLAQSASAGVATFGNLEIDLVGTGYTLTASATGPSNGVSSAFNITAGSAATLEFSVQPSTPQTAGVAFSPAVQVTARDDQGNVATSFSNQISLSITGGTGTANASLTGDPDVNASSGVATFSNLLIDSVGVGYTLTATATGVSSAISSAFTVDPGSAATLVFTAQPSNATAGSPISPAVVVTARDNQGNTATGFTNTVSVGITGGTGTGGALLSGTVDQSPSAGVATFADLEIDLVGTGYTLTASASGPSNGVSSAFDITAGSAATLEFTVQPLSPQTAGVAFSPAVQVTVRDDQGNVATSFGGQVSLAITGGTGTANASLTGDPDVNASLGIATFTNLLIDSAGVGYSLTASASGVTNIISSVFTVDPGAAATLEFTVPPTSPQTAGVAFSPAVEVTARDDQGNIATSYTDPVSLTLLDGTANATLTGTPVNASAGVATFSNLMIDSVGGGYRLLTTATGVTSDVSGSFTIDPGPAVALTFTSQPTDVTAGSAMSPAVVVTARDDQGNTASDFVGQITVALTGGTAGAAFTVGSTTQVNAVSGEATFSNLAVDSVGTNYGLQASGVGTPVASGTFSVTAGAAASLDFTVQPSNVTAGLPMASVEVTARDGQGNVATSFGDNVTLSLNGGPGGAGFTGSATTVETASSGIATFSSVRIDSVATGYTLTASASGPSSDISSPFDVTPGAAESLVFTAQPIATEQDATIPTVAVTARDSLGNTDTNFTGQVDIAITAGTGTALAQLAGSPSQSALAGVASFSDLSIDSVGTGYTLTATSGGLSDGISDSFDITAAPPPEDDALAMLGPFRDSSVQIGAAGRELAYTRSDEGWLETELEATAIQRHREAEDRRLRAT